MPEMPPAESDLLCEECGYILNGLPDTGNCPECGKPIAPSTTNNPRKPPAWEHASNSRFRNWLTTTVFVIFFPSSFFRGYISRCRHDISNSFAFFHYWISAFFFSLVLSLHLQIVMGDYYLDRKLGWLLSLISAIFGSPIVWITIAFITELACRLSAWEAAYRGLRLPLPVVRRAMHYHAAHIAVVALLTAITVVTFDILFSWRILHQSSIQIYLYVLCAEVILFAGYLFFTYWAAMRNIMFANR